MICHIVLFKPAVLLSDEQRGAILDLLEKVVASCPSVKGCRVGRRVLHGLPGYEQAMPEDYQYALLLDFEDVSGLRDYLQHPAHQRLGAIFSSGAQASLAYDYDLMTLGEASRMT